MVLLALLACTDTSVPLREDRQHDRDSAADTAADTAGDTATDTAADSGDTAVEPPEGCGDGAADGAHEECDGTDDGACPGACSDTCQCPSTAATGVLSLYVVDVWQGDGMLLVSPDGFTMLVDVGDEDTWPTFTRTLRGNGIEALDYTLASHQHSDHMGAMDLALDEHPEVGVAWDNGSRADSDAHTDYVAAAGDRRATVRVGDHLDLGASIDVEVLHADIGDRENENNNSVVLRVTYGDVRILLGGDCEYLVCEQSFDPGPIDVYKVHHHGSEDSSGPSLLASMQPTLALVSVGDGNDYGHPGEWTLVALEDAGAEVRRTDEEGTLRVDVDGAGYAVTSAVSR